MKTLRHITEFVNPHNDAVMRSEDHMDNGIGEELGRQEEWEPCGQMRWWNYFLQAIPQERMSADDVKEKGIRRVTNIGEVHPVTLFTKRWPDIVGETRQIVHKYLSTKNSFG